MRRAYRWERRAAGPVDEHAQFEPAENWQDARRNAMGEGVRGEHALRVAAGAGGRACAVRAGRGRSELAGGRSPGWRVGFGVDRQLETPAVLFVLVTVSRR